MAITTTPRKTHLDEPQLEIVISDALIGMHLIQNLKSAIGRSPQARRAWGNRRPSGPRGAGPEGIDLALLCANGK